MEVGSETGRFGVSRVVSALTVALVVVIAAGGAVSYLYTANNSSTQKTAAIEISTVTITSTTTQTVVIKAATSQEDLPTNLPKTCVTNYPNGLNLNNSNYFIITNFTMNFAQVCIKYTYGTNPNASSQLTTGGTFDAMFNYSSMFITDSFGNASSGGSYPYDIVIANPPSYLFNSSGESVVVVYTFEWSFIFSYFVPQYARCGSTLDGIGIAQTNGDGSSGLNSLCPAFSYGNLFNAELVGTS